ncbi:hypothetical protein [Idiomarina xiamenensis]|uniref:Uncharacterized protein n=1 Tax=Idiomarina xiamenensis 10-D-4 TaxID=740709 RepID=K2K865_9GAMM|nr:hypothetical protein [Idiomarina xiamenensis]EKE82767.1 hypothetical protein A10D4_09184 [Idiomarina xiamenensis 10-D-4]
MSLTQQQSGWLLFSGLLLTAILSLALFSLHRVSSDSRERWVMQNIADNAAEAGALILARQLNYLALSNRALIANQVVMAQLTGLSSWLAMLADASQRMAMVTSVIPYLNVLSRQLAVVLDRVSTVMDRLLPAALRLQQLIISALSTSQLLLQASFTSMLPSSISEFVAKHGDYNWQLWHSGSLLPFPVLWLRNIRRFRNDHATHGKQFASLVNRSRDPFSRRRSYRWLKAGPAKVEKAGASTLLIDGQGKWQWQAMDTLALHIDLLFDHDELAWGRGSRGQGRFHGYGQDFGGSRSVNPNTSTEAQWLYRRLLARQTNFYFYRLQQSAGQQSSSALVVTLDNGKQQVAARADARYSRPRRLFPRADQQLELGNLFNPLWFVQLRPLSAIDKARVASFEVAERAS